LDTDGWLASFSSFEVSRGDDGVVAVIQGTVPMIANPEFTTELRVRVNGVETKRQQLKVGKFRVLADVPPGSDRWRVELRFSAVQRLPAPDGRRVAAHIESLSFEPPALAEVHAPAPLSPAEMTAQASARALAAVAAKGTLRRVPPPPPDRIFTNEIVIRPSASPLTVQLRELWLYRHLFSALVWRNVRLEFDATRLGSIWAVSRPILFALVFGFFRNLSGANTYVDVPYVPYVYSGLLLWTYFTDAATNSASAIRTDVSLLTKIYYPRLLTPLVPTVSNLVTLAIGMIPLAILMAWFEIHPGWQLVLLPVVIVPCILLSLGLGLLVSALSLEDRDWERVLAFGLTIGLWLAPVIYAPDMIPHGVRDLYHLNPTAGMLLAFRAVMFDGIPFPVTEWLYSLVSSTAIFIVGLRVFRSTELRMVDRL
jgi:lipopolysaccharide transport system permease protein